MGGWKRGFRMPSCALLQMLVKMEAEALARGLQLVTSSSALEALRVGGEAGDLGDSGIPSRWHRCQDDDSQEEAANGGGVNDFVINPFSKRPSIYAGVYNPDEEDDSEKSKNSRDKEGVVKIRRLKLPNRIYPVLESYAGDFPTLTSKLLVHYSS